MRAERRRSHPSLISICIIRSAILTSLIHGGGFQCSSEICAKCTCRIRDLTCDWMCGERGPGHNVPLKLFREWLIVQEDPRVVELVVDLSSTSPTTGKAPSISQLFVSMRSIAFSWSGGGGHIQNRGRAGLNRAGFRDLMKLWGCHVWETLVGRYEAMKAGCGDKMKREVVRFFSLACWTSPNQVTRCPPMIPFSPTLFTANKVSYVLSLAPTHAFLAQQDGWHTEDLLRPHRRKVPPE